MQKKTDEATVDLETPSFSTAVSFSARTASTFTATWAATDNVTVASNLSYKVVSFSSNNITTVADALANGTIVQDWTVNSLTANFSALTDSTNYYVSVLVRDTDGNTGISAGATTTLCSGKAMFLATVPNGNLGGASGADGICAAQKPAGFTSATFRRCLLIAASDKPAMSVIAPPLPLVARVGCLQFHKNTAPQTTKRILAQRTQTVLLL